MCGDYREAQKEEPSKREDVIIELANYFTKFDFSLFSEMFVYYKSSYKIVASDIVGYIFSSIKENTLLKEEEVLLNKILEKLKKLEIEDAPYNEIKQFLRTEQQNILAIINIEKA